MATRGLRLGILKTDTNSFSIYKQASESVTSYSQASSGDVFFEPKSVILEEKNAHWTFNGIPDDRSDETEESLLIELRIILTKLSESDLGVLRALPVNGEVYSQMISDFCVTSDTSVQLSNVPIISPPVHRPARSSLWTAVTSLSEIEDINDTKPQGPKF